jgi:SPP1 gp7 family putative phage head morphogenesis protein
MGLDSWGLTKPGRMVKKSWPGMGLGFGDADFIPDGSTGHIIDAEVRELLGDRPEALALVALAYIAMQWRAQKIAEPPLMVVEEDQESGDEEWLPDHELVELFDEPSLDYDLGQLIQATSWYNDATGHSIWTIDRDRAGRPARLTPFSGDEFSTEPGKDDDGNARIRSLYQVTNTLGGIPKDFKPEDVVYFRDAPGVGPVRRRASRLGVAMEWLALGDDTRKKVHELVSIAAWPSLVMQPDREWNPSQADLERYEQKTLQRQRERKPLIMLGGGTATVVSARIRDLVPDEVLDRVEAVVAAVFGVPAVVLQYLVGIRNAPWSQLAEARRMAYTDAIKPAWVGIERPVTRQLLRPLDEDRTHFVRFDTSRIEALKESQLEAAQRVGLVARIASVNERRTMVGLEPDADPKADEVPELKQPDPLSLLGGFGANEEKAAWLRAMVEKRGLFAMLRADQAERAQFEWQFAALKQFERDQSAIVTLAERHLTGTKAETVSPAARAQFMKAVEAYLTDASAQMQTAVAPLVTRNAESVARAVVAEFRVSFQTLQPNVAAYARREAAWLVKGLTDTTRDQVREAVARGIEQGLGAREIAKGLRDLPAFTPERALLVARTETTRITNGAPTETLKELERRTGRRFVKTWSTALDDRVRDEHAAMEGETVGVAQDFSNGLQYPSDPNCRCVLLYNEEAA